jgi:hypothetical protein
MLDMARIGRECEEAVLTIYKCTGARGLYKVNPIQRYLRDTLAAANHITQDADNNAGALGDYGYGDDADLWRVFQGHAWFFRLGQDVPEIDWRSITLIEPNGEGGWQAVG